MIIAHSAPLQWEDALKASPDQWIVSIQANVCRHSAIACMPYDNNL